MSHNVSLRAADFLYKYLLKNNQKDQKIIKLMGINFAGELGLAAGFDKNGDYLNFSNNIGLGFIELGTVTPRAQYGNKKPRVYRVSNDMAIVNHLGFNNKGVLYLKNKLKSFERKIPIGVNVGKNSSTSLESAHEDYNYCIREIFDVCDYITLNISSPNTKDLRELHTKKYLNDFLYKVKRCCDELSKKNKKNIPILLKISPDHDEKKIEELCRIIDIHEIQGVILTNTSVDKSLLSTRKHDHTNGGVSGLPLLKKSTKMIEVCKKWLHTDTVIVGCGGIMSKSDADDKLRAGANLLQVYTGLVYKGLQLIKQINN